MPKAIAEQADDFAADLTGLFQLAFGPDVTFGVTATGNRYILGPEPFQQQRGGYARVPMRRPNDPASRRPPLELSVEFKCRGDRSDEYLAVYSSTFGLWVNAGARSNPRPVVRIEYDRDKTTKAAAHVHFHAESTEVGWLYGQAGLPVPRMQEFHFPLGGRRFRPTIEDFLSFIDSEGVYRYWHNSQAFHRRLKESHERWEEKQARAVAREHTSAVAAYLREVGWSVDPPSTAGPAVPADPPPTGGPLERGGE